MLIVASSTDAADAELQGLLGRELPDNAEHSRALELMRAHPAMSKAQAEADRWAQLGIDSLEEIRELAKRNPDVFASPERVAAVLSALEMICRSTAHREV